MSRSRMPKIAVLALVVVMSVAALWAFVPRAEAPDHGDSPAPSQDQGTDIGDVFAFLDPNDNSKVILAFDVHGFIVPAENANLGFFDHLARFRFQIENTGDAVGDIFYDVTFTRQTSRDSPQMATISERRSGVSFTAPTTVPSATDTVARAPVITTDPNTGIAFFAGLTDDPFFFDIPAELRYRASRTTPGATIDPSVFSRARDSFAGYNILMIVLSVPASRLRGLAGNVIGVNAQTQRRQGLFCIQRPLCPDGVLTFGEFATVDRMGIPLVNTVFIRPLALKDAYNRASTAEDAAGRFAGEVVAALQELQTTPPFITVLTDLAVFNGDMLRLNLAIPNTGPGGGNNPAAAFPNGRRPGDDVVDTILRLIDNGGATLGSGPVDYVSENDKPLRDVFPFFAAPHQPLGAGVIDDDTRN